MVGITVGIPVFNGGSLLRETLVNVLGQDADIVCRVSDNASTDATPQICAEFLQDGHITYERLPRNVGAIENFNRLARDAETEFFAWVAHDDIRTVNYFSTCVAALNRTPNGALAVPAIAILDWRIGRVVKRIEPPTCIGSRFAAKRVWGLFASVDAFALYGVYRTARVDPLENRWGSDLQFLLRLALSHELVPVPEATLLYRIWGEGPKVQEPEARNPDCVGWYRRLAKEVNISGLTRRGKASVFATLVLCLIHPRLRWRSQLLVQNNNARVRAAREGRRWAQLGYLAVHVGLRLLQAVVRPSSVIRR